MGQGFVPLFAVHASLETVSVENVLATDVPGPRYNPAIDVSQHLLPFKRFIPTFSSTESMMTNRRDTTFSEVRCTTTNSSKRSLTFVLGLTPPLDGSSFASFPVYDPNLQAFPFGDRQT